MSVDDEDLRALLVYAYRYGLARRSYASTDVRGLLIKYGQGLLHAHDWRTVAEDAERLESGGGMREFAEWAREQERKGGGRVE